MLHGSWPGGLLRRWVRAPAVTAAVVVVAIEPEGPGRGASTTGDARTRRSTMLVNARAIAVSLLAFDIHVRLLLDCVPSHATRPELSIEGPAACNTCLLVTLSMLARQQRH
eukprot:scaffold630_cov399-Prasinococcus_capsulatus_cf.AAC.8